MFKFRPRQWVWDVVRRLFPWARLQRRTLAARSPAAPRFQRRPEMLVLEDRDHPGSIFGDPLAGSLFPLWQRAAAATEQPRAHPAPARQADLEQRARPEASRWWLSHHATQSPSGTLGNPPQWAPPALPELPREWFERGGSGGLLAGELPPRFPGAQPQQSGFATTAAGAGQSAIQPLQLESSSGSSAGTPAPDGK